MQVKIAAFDKKRCQIDNNYNGEEKKTHPLIVAISLTHDGRRYSCLQNDCRRLFCAHDVCVHLTTREVVRITFGWLFVFALCHVQCSGAEV